MFLFLHFLVQTQDHYTALHIAVKHCKPQVVQILLGYGANVQLRGGKVRPLTHIISSALLSTAPPSLPLDVSLNRIHFCVFSLQAEETPLHIAARIKDGEKVAEMLIKSGADVNAPSDVRNSALLRSQ